MLRAFREEALHQFQAERCGGSNEVGVVVRDRGGAAAGKGVADLVHGKAFDRAGRSKKEENQSKESGEPGVAGVRRPAPHIRTAIVCHLSQRVPIDKREKMKGWPREQ